MIEKKRKEDEEKREKELEAKLQSEKMESDALNFYKSCYNFHILENTPIYELLRAKNKIAAIYVGNDHSLNFLKIDGYGKEENNATIPYDKIHYYEKLEISIMWQIFMAIIQVMEGALPVVIFQN